MTTQEFIEFAGREVARLRWYEEAKGFAEGLLTLHRDQASAMAERDAAVAERKKILAELDAAKTAAARASAARLAELSAEITRRQQADLDAVAKAEAELRRVQVQIDRARGLALQAEEELHTARATNAEEARTLTARIDALKAEDRILTERLTAALKR